MFPPPLLAPPPVRQIVHRNPRLVGTIIGPLAGPMDNIVRGAAAAADAAAACGGRVRARLGPLTGLKACVCAPAVECFKLHWPPVIALRTQTSSLRRSFVCFTRVYRSARFLHLQHCRRIHNKTTTQNYQAKGSTANHTHFYNSKSACSVPSSPPLPAARQLTTRPGALSDKS